MIIGFDASKVPYAERRGLGQYSVQLLESLSQVDQENTYKLFYNHLRRGRNSEMFIGPDKRFKNCLVPAPARLLNSLWMKREMFRIELFLGRLDVFHSPFERIPPTRCKTVVTVHGLIYLRLPELFHKKYYDNSLNRLKQVCKKADLIIAISQNTLNDICHFTDFPADRIRVIPDGVHSRFKQIDNSILKSIRVKYSLPQNYCLYVGAASANKNLDRLIEAFKILMDTKKNDCPLVFAGKIGWGYKKVLAKAEDMGLGRRIIFLDYVPDEDLPLLYSAASLFVFPSLYEGFGMPLIESMASGTPVACSNRGAMKEVAGDAAMLFDPENPEEIAWAIDEVLVNESLRKNLIDKGKRHAENFRWDSIARQIINVYNELC